MLQRLHFDIWYLFHPPWDTGISPPELLSYLDTHRPGRVIDLGCGSGTNILTLACRGWQVAGIDFSARAVRIARRKLRSAGLAANLSVADVTRPLRIRGPFDLALDIGCFHAIDDRDRYLSNLTAILAPAGHWLMYGFLNQGSDRKRVGLGPSDLELISTYGLRLRERTDGFDRAMHPSAWFRFEKGPPPIDRGAHSL